MTELSRRRLLQGAALALAARPLYGLAQGLPQESGQDDSEAARRLQRAFIWTQAEAPEGQVFAAFRKTITLAGQPLRAILRLFADTRYVLWINGEYILRGPCRFDPKRPEYDLLSIAQYLHAGKNTLAVLVHAAGYVDDYTHGDAARNFALQSARVMAHRPGLAAELAVSGGLHTTDATWRTTTETQYLPAPPTYTSFFDNIDAQRVHGDWTRPDFDDSSWSAAVPIPGDAWGAIHARSIPLLNEKDVQPLTIVGVQPNTLPAGELSEKLPIELPAGSQIVLDLHREAQAYPVLRFDADAGTKIEVQGAVRYFDTGRKLDDAAFPGNPRSHQYTARAGAQTFMATDTEGMKYLAIRVLSGRIRLEGVQVIERRYPYMRLGSFQCADTLLNRVWQISVSTIELCSEDAHVDCADRERAQWMADGYIVGYGVSRTVLAGPGHYDRARYADSRLLRNMLRHVALSQAPDGRIQPMRPSNYPIEATHGIINDYACLWVQAVAEIYRRDGDLDFVKELWPVLLKVVGYYQRRVTDLGLLHSGEFIYFNNPLIYVACEGAAINAYFHRSLKDAAMLARALGDAANAEKLDTSAKQLLAAYNQHLWDETAGTYRGAIVRSPSVPVDTPPSYAKANPMPLDAEHRTPPTGHAAMMALYYEMVPAEHTASVLAAMRKLLPIEEPFPYSCYFWMDVLYRHDSEELDREVLALIRDKWAQMTKRETGTTSEDFPGGSYVHEAGALPAYFFQSYVLGVRTEGERASRKLIVDPRLGDLASADGTTLTEFGPVGVKWARDSRNTLTFEIENRNAITAEVSLRLPSEKSSLVVDSNVILKAGVATADAKVESGRVFFVLQPGRHSGSLASEPA